MDGLQSPAVTSKFIPALYSHLISSLGHSDFTLFLLFSSLYASSFILSFLFLISPVSPFTSPFFFFSLFYRSHSFSFILHNSTIRQTQ
jgi:hypothetical protein